ncbi:MAG: hypothetical protein R2713_02090 [Ilumatobacteraceae bacterium]|nr:hypothetical protein [Acidimicrobiales bacterium]MCB9394331.1 hypothetical protein [Acidimicrobiaceae bacterium]
MRSLRKRDVETLLADYDGDPVGALAAAMQQVLEMPGEVFPALVRAAGLPVDRQRRLLDHEVDALDELARELNETRTLGSAATPAGR